MFALSRVCVKIDMKNYSTKTDIIDANRFARVDKSRVPKEPWGAPGSEEFHWKSRGGLGWSNGVVAPGGG